MRVRISFGSVLFAAAIALRFSARLTLSQEQVSPPAISDSASEAPNKALDYDASTDAGAFHRWRTSVDEAGNPTGQYLEMASGLNRWDPAAQQWGESSVRLEVYEGGGAISRKTAYDAIFAPSADNGAVFDILMPADPSGADRVRFSGQAVGIALTDRRTGQSLWIAEVGNVGGLVNADADEVIYPNCLTGEGGFSASVHYKLSLAGIAQLVELHTVLPGLGDSGFPADDPNVAVEIWTEVLEAPKLSVRTRNIVGQEDLTDSAIDFGPMRMRMGSGRGYSAETAAQGKVASFGETIPIRKEYVELNGMRFIVESAEYAAVAAQAAGLKPLAASPPS